VARLPWPIGAVFDYGATAQNDRLGVGPEPVLGFLAGLGVTRIQGFFAAIGPKVAADFTKVLARFGLTADSVHAPFNGEALDPSAADGAAREHAVSLMEDFVRFTADLGAEFLIVHAGRCIPDETERAQRFERAVVSMRRLAAFAEARGVRIALENLPEGFLPVTPGEVLALIEAVGHAAAGVCFDTGHANLVWRSVPDYLEQVVPHVCTVHLHDNDGTSDAHLAPGEGDIDWPRVLGILRDAGFSGTFMLEWGLIYLADAPKRAPALRKRLKAWAASLQSV